MLFPSLALPKWSEFHALKIPEQQALNIRSGDHAWSLGPQTVFVELCPRKGSVLLVAHHCSSASSCYTAPVACSTVCVLLPELPQWPGKSGGSVWAADVTARPVFPHMDPSTSRRLEVAALGWMLLSLWRRSPLPLVRQELAAWVIALKIFLIGF